MSGAILMGRFLIIIAIAGLTMPLAAQAPTRAQQIEQARKKKAEQLEPEKTASFVGKMELLKEPGNLEEFLTTGEGSDGFQPIGFGGTRSGHGFSYGVGYALRDLFGGRAHFKSRVRGTVARAFLFGADFEMPRLAHNKHFLEINAQYENSPRMDYYGKGSGSREADRTSYLLEDASVDLTSGVRLTRNLRLGVTGGIYRVNVGPGKRPGFPSTEELFTHTQAPGIIQQTNYLRGGPFIEFDWLSEPGRARSGGLYRASLRAYDDRKLHAHDFRQLEIEASQYFPYLNGSRTVALNGYASINLAGDGKQVPFYLQPYLGSSHRLRGFRRYRFHDDNAVHMTAEHRWDVFSGMDMALFVDAGKVAPKWRKLTLDKLEYSAGVGFRATIRGGVFMRLDFAVSREGLMFWWAWSDVF
ncbi:MAG: BamA/TamA family outer membrane protein [bacterium]|nr:BamA/TamA family outer membrane protein [bacterium]